MKKYIIFACLIMMAFACSSDQVDKSTSVILPDNEFDTDFDKFLKREFKDTYNIEFMYRMPDTETRLEYDVVPAAYAQSVQMANIIKYFCLEPYEKVVSREFLVEYFPKLLVMVGSSAFKKTDGKELAGEAEGGNKIALFKINNLTIRTASALFSGYLRTIYHEFSHILHLKKDYPNEFRQITASKYNNDSWVSYSDTQARKEGFISAYSMKDPNEDFVELIAHYIVNTPTQWNNILNNAAEGKPIIEEKMVMVKEYLQTQWQIDLDALRNEIQDRGANMNTYDFNNIN